MVGGRRAQVYQMGPGAADRKQISLQVGSDGVLHREKEGGIGTKGLVGVCTL